MCTYIVLRDVLGPGTVAFAGNRDERLARPFREPARVGDAVLPLDHLGGTWFGMTAGLLVALTNAPGSEVEASARSRGFLVRDALAAGSLDAALESVQSALARSTHDGFNLLIADPLRAVVVAHGPRGATLLDVASGAHVIEHRQPGLRPLDVLAGDPPGAPEPELERIARRLLASHETLAATGHPPCRHEGERGTVATMLAMLGPAPFLLFSRGPACHARFTRHEIPAARWRVPADETRAVERGHV